MIYPMFAMVILTFVVMLITVRVRVQSVRRGEVSLSYFSLMQGDKIPSMVTKTSRHFSNLFEMPLLFYVAGTLYIALDLSIPLAISFAWAFVVTRCLHSGIHLSYNNVMHRLFVFALSNLCVLALWISIVLAISS